MINQLDNVHGERKEAIPPDDVVVGSIDLQDGERHHEIIQGGLQDDKHLELHKEILPNDIDDVDSCTTESIDPQEYP